MEHNADRTWKTILRKQPGSENERAVKLVFENNVCIAQSAFSVRLFDCQQQPEILPSLPGFKNAFLKKPDWDSRDTYIITMQMLGFYSQSTSRQRWKG